MEQFTEIEKKNYWPQWVNGQVVKTQEDHIAKFPEHYEQWVTTINPPPKSEAELNAAILAEREECIKFVSNYPTGVLLAKEIAGALRKSRYSGGNSAPVVATGSMNKSTSKSRQIARDKVAPVETVGGTTEPAIETHSESEPEPVTA